ncbi:hypothetical protein ND748_03345 [Frankia sp. AiPs1]|uniref:hypothetical protein n=1 Tax=Frankia sp. AiPs1 TaxID=573493 RepID=UPI0020432FE7|nr:hypothetical protein [Frankia sp. AiPs1]MCM3920711.1 hypothetical protein [Frankia sp. AiPs1]
MVTSSGGSTDGRDAGRSGEVFPRRPSEGGAAAMAGADASDPVSPLRFGGEPGLLATEDAANPPFEGLSANSSFANEIKERDN